MSTNEYSKRREIKELIKAEIKGNIKEFGPLKDLQGIVRGIASKVYDKKKNIKNYEIDQKVAVVKKKRRSAYDNLLKLAKKLEKEYGSWDKVPFGFKNNIEKSIPNFEKEFNSI